MKTKEKGTRINVPQNLLSGVISSLRAAKIPHRDMAASLGITLSVVRNYIHSENLESLRCQEPHQKHTNSLISYSKKGKRKLVKPSIFLEELNLGKSVAVPDSVHRELKDSFKHVVREYTLFKEFRDKNRIAHWVNRIRGKKGSRELHDEDITVEDLSLTPLSCHKGHIFQNQYILWVRFTFALHFKLERQEYSVESMHFVPKEQIEGKEAPPTAGYEFQSVVDRTDFPSSMKLQCYSLPLLKFSVVSAVGKEEILDSEEEEEGSSLDSWSLNGSVVVLGMGGNIIGIQLANTILSGVHKSSPNFSLHIAELEPVVVGACVEHSLLGEGSDPCRTFIYSGDDSLEDLPGLLNLVDSNAKKATGMEKPPVQLLIIDCFDPALGKTNVGESNSLFRACLLNCVNRGGILVLNTHFSQKGESTPIVRALADHVGSIMGMLPAGEASQYQFSALHIDRLLQAIVVVQLKATSGRTRNATYFCNPPSTHIEQVLGLRNLLGGCTWSLRDHCSHKLDVQVVVNDTKQKVAIYSHFHTIAQIID